MTNQNQTTNQQTSLVANKQSLRTLLAADRVTQTLQRVGTRWLSADQIKTQAMIAVARNPKLLNCTRFSFLESVVRAAELGLRFAGAGGEAYLIPYKTKCTLIIGYRGLCALARRTGKVIRIEARCVHEKDVFKIEYGHSQQLIHRPHLGPDRGEITCAYAIGELRGGSVQLEVMTRVQIDQIRARSRASNDGPWKTDYEEMSRKTVLRRLCKYLPFPTAFEDALAAEEPPIEDQHRKPVETQDVIPDNIDIQTGEIIDGDNQTDVDFDDEQPVKAPAEGSQQKEKDIAGEKKQLLTQIRNELVTRWPGDSKENKKLKQEEIRLVFGCNTWKKVSTLTNDILGAGLRVLRDRASGADFFDGDNNEETATVDDIPF